MSLIKIKLTKKEHIIHIPAVLSVVWLVSCLSDLPMRYPCGICCSPVGANQPGVQCEARLLWPLLHLQTLPACLSSTLSTSPSIRPNVQSANSSGSLLEYLLFVRHAHKIYTRVRSAAVQLGQTSQESSVKPACGGTIFQCLGITSTEYAYLQNMDDGWCCPSCWKLPADCSSLPATPAPVADNPATPGRLPPVAARCCPLPCCCLPPGWFRHPLRQCLQPATQTG